jgi:hypothetical protein
VVISLGMTGLGPSPLRPWRLCARYSEFQLRLYRAVSPCRMPVHSKRAGAFISSCDGECHSSAYLTVSSRRTIVKVIYEERAEQSTHGGNMKAVAFRSKVNADGTIQLPKKMWRSIKGDEVRVILLWPDSVDDASLWEQESIKTFLAEDGPNDALYDTL